MYYFCKADVTLLFVTNTEHICTVYPEIYTYMVRYVNEPQF